MWGILDTQQDIPIPLSFYSQDYSKLCVCPIVDDDVHICTCLVDVAVGGIAAMFHGGINLGMHLVVGAVLPGFCVPVAKTSEGLLGPVPATGVLGRASRQLHWYILLVALFLPGEGHS